MEELVKDDEKILWEKNLKSMGLIFELVKSDFIPSKDDICGIRILVDNFPIFTKINPPEVLKYYLESCLKDGIDPLVDPFNLPETYPDVHGKRKKESREKESSRPQKKKKKVANFLDEDEVSLSERQKAILMKDTSGVVQQSSEAFETSTYGKLPKVINHFVSVSINSERVLPTQPPPISQPIPSHSQSIPISQLLLTETLILEPILEPFTETPKVSETQLQQQQQQIPQTPPPS